MKSKKRLLEGVVFITRIKEVAEYFAQKEQKKPKLFVMTTCYLVYQCSFILFYKEKINSSHLTCHDILGFFFMKRQISCSWDMTLRSSTF